MNRKLLIGIVILFGILPLIVLWFVSKNKNQNTVGQIKVNPIVKPYIDFLDKVTTKIDWQKIVDKKYQTINIYSVKKTVLTDSEKEKWQKLLNTNGTDNYFKLDESNGEFEYNQKIDSKDKIKNGSLTNNEIGTSFYSDINSVINTGKLEIKIDQFAYKQFLYPWWISATENEASVIEVLANYYFNGVPIYTPTGYPIKVDFFKNGEIVKMVGILSFNNTTVIENKKLLSLDEIKNMDVNNFFIWSIDGGMNYELSEETPKMSDISLNSYSLGYILNSNNILWPYYFLQGESNLSTGLAKVVIVVSAIK